MYFYPKSRKSFNPVNFLIIMFIITYRFATIYQTVDNLQTEKYAKYLLVWYNLKSRFIIK